MGQFVLSGLIFLSTFVFGFIAYKFFINKKTKSKKVSKLIGIELIQDKKVKEPINNNCKKYTLIIMASVCAFAGTMIRKLEIINSKTSKSLECRLRSFQIIVSSSLCYCILRIKIYKHQLCSLIVISICLILVIISEFILHKGIDNEIDEEIIL
jgi:hypothetical protein